MGAIKGPRTLAGAVVQELRDRILAGHFEDGEPLRQEALAKELGVSRVPIREALLQLEAEGLVDIHEHRGAVVADLSFDDIREILELRALLEIDALKHAIGKRSQADVEEAERLLGEFGVALENNNVAEWGRLNADFHLLLYKPSGRQNTLKLLANLHRKSDRFIRLQISINQFHHRAHDEHTELLKFYAEGDLSQACSLLEAHIRGAATSMKDYLAVK